MAGESIHQEALGPLVLTLLTEQTPGVLTTGAQNCTRKEPEACQQLQSQVERKSGQLTSSPAWAFSPGLWAPSKPETVALPPGSAMVTPDEAHPNALHFKPETLQWIK